MFICPKCQSENIRMCFESKAMADAIVVNMGIEIRDLQPVEKTEVYFCKGCGFILPCNTEKELVNYVRKQESERRIRQKANENGVCLIVVSPHKCPEYKFIVEYLNSTDEVLYALQVKYAEELVGILFNNPEVNIQFASQR